MKLYMLACMDAECQSVEGIMFVDADSLEQAIVLAHATGELASSCFGVEVPAVALRNVQEIPRNLIVPQSVLVDHVWTVHELTRTA
jgi:hypothetical protein